MFLEKVRKFVIKLQSLSDVEKKGILLGIIIVFGLILGAWWLFSSARIISRIDEGATLVSLPPLDAPEMKALDDLKNVGQEVRDAGSSVIGEVQGQFADTSVQEPVSEEFSPDTTETTDAAGWQTYANSEYSFKVTYPPGYFLKEQTHKENYLLYVNFYKTQTPEPNGLPIPYVSVSVYNQPASFETWLKENGIQKWERNEDFWVDGQKATYLTNPSDLGVAALVVIPHGDKLFSLANFDSSSFKKFVSSFKFTD